MKFFVFFVILSLKRGSAAVEPSESLHVTTEYGPIQGGYLNASENRVLAGFLGVPYARPPIGSLRFRATQDPLPWKSVRMAIEDPPSCIQRKDHFFGDFEGSQQREPKENSSEDCLYLNIYVPDVILEQNSSSRDGLAVLVWFHGGGFARGASVLKGSKIKSNSGSESQNWSPDPREIAVEGGVIVVSVQYRLGSFGFLFFDDESAPGNVGLLDQRKALGWIKRNIFAFGGDPTR